MIEKILQTAREDERIRAVLMTGSRADPDRPKDRYQDHDIVYFVTDVSPYWDNEAWVEEHFGRPALLQKPESMHLIPPDGDGSYIYLMIFPDGSRIDLQITKDPYIHDGEPAVLLLDKDGTFPPLTVDPAHWHVQPPSPSDFADCCNEFHWCLNNLAKSTVRGELPFAMEMMNHYIRDMLLLMLQWVAGADHGFAVNVGKKGQFFYRYLRPDLYERFLMTYCDARPEHIWETAFLMLSLFGDAARDLAGCMGFTYNEEEEKAILEYMLKVRSCEI